ncbi:hypothetical protein PHSC3_001423 [Chlamydiales bacterium STE3]|nr:hypothetical protein PHSC3_001423 [Chlamydiales bacterium STE3]
MSATNPSSNGSLNGSSLDPFNPNQGFKAGTTPSLQRIDKSTKIPDDQEPISYIESKIIEATGKKIEECKDLKIESSFTTVKDGDAIKTMAYRDPPQSLKAPSCFYFERSWTIQVLDKDGVEQTIELKKNIYTNVVIPTNNDANLYDDRQMMAGLAAGAYSTVVDSAILHKTGQPAKYQLTMDQITKVQRDNFLIMGLFHGSKQLSPNKMKQASGYTMHVTHIQLQFRAGKKDARDEGSEDSAYLVHLAQKVNATSTKTISQLERSKKYVLTADDDSLPEIRELAKIQKFRVIDDQLSAPGVTADQLIDEIDDQDIDREQIADHYRTANERANNDFNILRNMFTDPSSIDNVLNMNNKGVSAVSQGIKALLSQTTPQKGIKGWFSKSKQPEYLGVLKNLIEASKSNSDDEIAKLLTSFQSVYRQMEKSHIELVKREDVLKKITVSDDELDEIDEQREFRENELREIKAILDKIDEIEDENLGFPINPKTSVESDSEDEEEDSTLSGSDDSTSLLRKRQTPPS